MPAQEPIRHDTYGTENGVPYSEPSSHPRRLILCFDGTANLFDDTNTNVVRLVSYLKKDNMQEQQVYYQSGVGTYIKPSWFMPLTIKMLQLADEGIAWDIGSHIMGGYKFLMANWIPGSKISIFGFSRGAYTARALAGMLHKVGLLSRGNEEQVPFAYKMYENQGAEGWKMSKGFKKAFCHDVKVDFLGVWDTVASVGIFTVQDLPFSASDHHIRVFRHAISLDERRCKFKANLWQAAFIPPGETAASAGTILHDEPAAAQHRKPRDDDDDVGSMDGFFEEDGHSHVTDVKEVWFSGGHGDVGGGNVPNATPLNASRIPLTWMIREIVLANTGIVFDEDALGSDGISLPTPNPSPVLAGPSGQNGSNGNGNGTSLAPLELVIKPQNYVSRLNEHYEQDVTALISDQLKLKWAWWILEVMPFTYRIASTKGGPGHWKLSPWPNNGGPRARPEGRMNVHVSVQERMKKTGYKPKVQWTEEPEWVN